MLCVTGNAFFLALLALAFTPVCQFLSSIWYIFWSLLAILSLISTFWTYFDHHGLLLYLTLDNFYSVWADLRNYFGLDLTPYEHFWSILILLTITQNAAQLILTKSYFYGHFHFNSYVLIITSNILQGFVVFQCTFLLACLCLRFYKYLAN